MNQEITSQPQEPSGLGGWLVLVGCDLVASITALGFVADQSLIILAQSGTQGPGVDSHGFYGLVQFLLWGALALIVLAVFSLALFFRKDRRFVNVFLAFLVVSILYLGCSYLQAISIHAPGPNLINSVTSQIGNDLWKSAASFLIASLYLKRSRRVKNTFVA
jgi:hypothetical protein